MTFEEILDQALAMLQWRGRVTYRALKLQFSLDDDHLEALKEELLYAHAHVVDDEGRGLVWTGAAHPTPTLGVSLALNQERAPLSYTPSHLTEKSWRPAPSWKASASRSPCSLPTSRTRRS